MTEADKKDPRTHALSIRWTDEERDLIDWLAGQRGMDATAYVRLAVQTFAGPQWGLTRPSPKTLGGALEGKRA